eukprot:5437106-Alexandrium_andersonii.AAC.1
MSASLVGSEMCIRDRPEPILVRRTPSAVRPWPRQGATLPPSSPGVVSVSYTHLTLPTICSV